ncbi:cation:proton antiporter domain-containing protein [Gymnodinialimonas hymeniacidonis]|uniref:cation:proton antiporter domain-containing protein n=1 Tax=Gymnodinialimonas hymeniacidonis TaxID=3126508 RepID=UPI0034C5EB45
MLIFDPKDIFYLIAGMAFFGLTVLPMMCGIRLISVPTLYVAVGMVIGLLAPAMDFIDPMAGEGPRVLLEHMTELIVIVALAGAGLAVDRVAGRSEWQHTWVLLGVVMPITVVIVAWIAMSFLGLSLAAAVLLGGCLAPTDPVLARSVQVDGPNEGEEDDVRVSLTTEAGINDGLAFPVIWLAVVLAGVTVTTDRWITSDWFVGWLTLDVFYRLTVGAAVGWAAGWAFGKIVLSRWGDSATGGENAGLVMIASTFMAYGLTEAFEGYGFLAVFVAARTARGLSRGDDSDEYVTQPHRFSDQIEKILLAILLLWLGIYAVSGILDETTWAEVMLAVLLIFVIRPLIGIITLWPTRGSLLEKGAIAMFGIRGMGSFFYIAFAQGHGEFPQIESVWRVAILTVLISILIHGMLAPLVMEQLRLRRKAAQAGDDREPGVARSS